MSASAGGSENRLQLWRAPTAGQRPHEFWQLVARERGTATCAAFSPDGTFVAVGTDGRQVLVWPMPSAKEVNGQLTADLSLVEQSNISERTLKLVGIGRNNWLFLGSDQGGKTAAVLFSFTATCKHLGIDTFAYLRDVLTRLPTQPPEQLAELLPDRWQAARCAAAAAPAPPDNAAPAP